MQGRDSGYIGQKMLNTELPGRRKRERGSPRRKFMDVVKEDIQRVCVTDARDRPRWRQMIGCRPTSFCGYYVQ